MKKENLFFINSFFNLKTTIYEENKDFELYFEEQFLEQKSFLFSLLLFTLIVNSPSQYLQIFILFSIII